MIARSMGLLTVGSLLLASASAAHSAEPATTPAALIVEPAQLVLAHAEDQQHLLVSAKAADGSTRDLTRQVQYTSCNPAVAARLASPASRATRLAQTKMTDAQIIEELYLSVLCRLPQMNEMELMQEHFANAGDRLKATQDAMWVLLNTREFLFNH